MALLLLAALPLVAQAIAPEESLAVTKIDPPNWYSTLPEPIVAASWPGLTRYVSKKRADGQGPSHWLTLCHGRIEAAIKLFSLFPSARRGT